MADEPRRVQRGAKREKGRKRPKGGNALLLFLLFGAAPLAVVGWFLLQGDERQKELLARLPEGVGGRATRAGICLLVLTGLSMVALPAFHGASKALGAVLGRMRTAPTWRRALLYPIELLLGLLWLVLQVSYAVDVLLIVLAALALLLATARIIFPDALPWLVPQL